MSNLWGVETTAEGGGSNFYAVVADSAPLARQFAASTGDVVLRIAPLDEMLEEQYDGVALLGTW